MPTSQLRLFLTSLGFQGAVIQTNCVAVLLRDQPDRKNRAETPIKNRTKIQQKISRHPTQHTTRLTWEPALLQRRVFVVIPDAVGLEAIQQALAHGKQMVQYGAQQNPNCFASSDPHHDISKQLVDTTFV